jgi:hypothetical protein
MVLVLAILPVAARRLGGDGAPRPEAAVDGTAPTDGIVTPPPAPGLHGRLVFTTFETRGSLERQQQLWVLDLETGALTEGPLVPVAEELSVADEERGWLVLVGTGPDAQGIAYLLTALTTTAEPLELGRGDLLSLSGDGEHLLVGRTEPTGRTGPGCRDHRFELHSVSVESGAGSILADGTLSCGNLVSGTLVDGVPLVSVVVDGRPEIWLVRPGDYEVLFTDLAYFSSSPRGTFLLVDPEGEVLRGLGVWPRTPTGRLLVWPGAGAPRPLLDAPRLFAQRTLAWSPSGSHVVVNGIVGDRRGMWLVYVPGGRVESLLPPNSFPLRSGFSGAAFDDRGTVFAGAPGALVARTEAGIVPLPLPPDAPSPAGPVAWLP